MGVFKLGRETTKCRIVFLSNLCERDKSRNITVSHNQSIHSGPDLNGKLATSILQLRFGSHLLCFDIVKAFNNIVLSELDQNRNLFLWFRNVRENDFSIIAYRNVRLPFGLRCSPALLMMALYKILVLDDSPDDKSAYLKKLIYQLSYMDNCAVTADSRSELEDAYRLSQQVFQPYKFGLQQFITNDSQLQNEIDSETDSKSDDEVKLLGLRWNRLSDELSTKPIELDINARTKREILSSIASQFDLFNFNGPILNRSRLFLHTLQCDKSLGWDDSLPSESIREWNNICKMANNKPPINIRRCVGSRDDTYDLIAFSDSSKSIFGAVLFLHNLVTDEVSFVMAKNRIVNKQLQNKSIPSLELQGVVLATECLLDLYDQLSGPSCILKLKISNLFVYSDSLVSLSWLSSFSNDLAKMQKHSVFVQNRLKYVGELCCKHPVNFSFVSGFENPADAITRCMSHKTLSNSNYFSGPEYLKGNRSSEMSCKDTLNVIIPNPAICVSMDVNICADHPVTNDWCRDLEKISDRCSSFAKVVSIHTYVLKFVQSLKRKINLKVGTDKYEILTDVDCKLQSYRSVIRSDQQKHFPEIFQYFEGKCRKSDIPDLVSKLNVYLDEDSLLRVKSKFDRSSDNRQQRSFPILLSKDSRLTVLIIEDCHKKLNHAGIYSMLTQLRKQFWLCSYFSKVKKVIKSCVVCRRNNSRAIKLNQNSYRELRLDPVCIPYRSVYLDYLGYYLIRVGDQKEKIWLLCVTCVYTRAINLIICRNQSLDVFLKSFQTHCYQFGLPTHCVADLGSQIVAGSNLIKDLLKDPRTKEFFAERNVKSLEFDHYYKGCSKLGALVESCVKLTKRLLFGAIRNNVLKLDDFELLLAQTIHLVNRRPIAFNDSLRDSSTSCEPDVITPEMMVYGYELLSLNVIPELSTEPEPDPEWQDSNPIRSIRNNYSQLRSVRNRLLELYHSEYLSTLLRQATNVPGRYLPVKHDLIKKGDIVLIKDPLLKPSGYPMAVVVDTTVNSLGEVTAAQLKKGDTGETVKRHSSCIVPLLSVDEEYDVHDAVVPEVTAIARSRVKRKAAEKCEARNKLLLS